MKTFTQEHKQRYLAYREEEIKYAFGLNQEQNNTTQEQKQAYELPVISEIIKIIFYSKTLEELQQRYRELHYPNLFGTGENKMEKYSVQIDKKKLEQQKKEAGEKTANKYDPKINVPKDPNLGTEPYERKPNG